MNKIISYLMDKKTKRVTFWILFSFDIFVFLIILGNGRIFITSLLLLLLFNVIIWVVVGLVYKCPNCNELYGLDFVGSRLISERQSTMQVRNNIRDRYGKVIASVDDNVPAIRRDYIYTYKCSKCNCYTQKNRTYKTRD